MAEPERNAGGETRTAPPAIELRSVSKSFGTVRANRDINLSVAAGSIHGIVGENGAGKSTLMNILYGLHAADEGEILIDGNPADIHGSADAIGLGIGMVHQHFMLVPNFSVLENVMLGSEGGLFLSEGETGARAMLSQLAHEYGMHVDADALIEDLPVGIRQRVEIIKAIKGGARILILDEPTGVLTPQEVESLFSILTTLKERGVTILLITHKLAEIMAITDAVSIMRDGTMVGHRQTSQTNTGELAELMVGREVLLRVDRGASRPGEVCLSAKQLSCYSKSGFPLLQNISFEVRAGEILGIAGVAGNGQTELLEVLTGMRIPDEGSLHLGGTEISSKNFRMPDAMRELGVGHIPEDRHHHGLVLEFQALENFVLGFHSKSPAVRGMFLDKSGIRTLSESLIREYDVRPANPEQKARNFSGGNQQKIVVAREMNANPALLIVGQPTRGVDIGAIEFIHKQLIRLRNEGCAIVIVSVELDEILGLSDRIMVMNQGMQVGIVSREEADEKSIGLMMAGISGDTAA